MRRRSPGDRPAVMDTKIGAASIGLITEKSDENASTTNLASDEENIRGARTRILARGAGKRRPERDFQGPAALCLREDSCRKNPGRATV